MRTAFRRLYRQPLAAARLSASVTLLAMVFSLLGCPDGRAPRVPDCGGPDSGQPGDTLRFWARTTDPRAEEISYIFAWNDTTPWGWTPDLASGDTFLRTRAFADTGLYELRVKARNRSGRETDWSAPFFTVIRYDGPFITGSITGPSQVREDSLALFSVAPGHVRAESVSVQFDWGDTTGAWSDFGAPAKPFTDSHRFTRYGPAAVRARGRDRAGNISPWSAPETVLVLRRVLLPPQNLTIRASTGTTVRLRWETGSGQDPVLYRLWFAPLGADFSVIDTTRYYWYVHDPIGATGRYTVSARRDTEEVFARETLSTVPILTDTTLIWELNAGPAHGFGWDTLTGLGRTLDIRDSAQAHACDAYFTDFAMGSSGPSFYLASPHMIEQDPGRESIPDIPWRRTWFLPIFGNVQWPLPEFDSTNYQPIASVNVLESYYSTRTGDGHFALAKNLGPDPERGTVRIISWFQRIRGLRLIQHEEEGR